MNIRPKTMRRLVILAAGATLLFGLAVGGIWLGKQATAREMEQRRNAGLRLFEAGEFEQSMLSLSPYITYTNQEKLKDPEALFAYSKSRSRIEEPSGKHLFEGIEGLRQVLRIQPDHEQAQRLLLELYNKVGYNAESVGLADELLQRYPDDAEVLRYKGVALQRLRRFDESLKVSQRLNELNPVDLRGLLLTFETMAYMEQPAEEIVDWADALRQKHPDDPRFELLMAYAHGYARDEARARTWLRTAASRTPPDAEFVKEVASLFDRLRSYDESLAVLERFSAAGNDPQILRILVQRLWQNGNPTAVLQRLQSLDPADPQSDSVLLAFKAMSLYQTGEEEAAKQIVDVLSRRPTDEKAMAWSLALQAHFSEEEIEPRALVDRLRTAIVRDPDNAVLRYLLGQAYAQLGQIDEALGLWRRAAELAPSWSMPYIMVARTLTKLGQTHAAVEDARRAVDRAPTALAPAKALAVAWYARAQEGGNETEVRNLLDFVSQIQKYVPGEPETLPIYVDLLARTNQKDEAVAAVRAALADGKPRPPETLVRLVEVLQQQGLGLEQDVLAHARQSHGATPAIALANAGVLARGGKVEEGLALLQKAAAEDPKDSKTQWDLAIAAYLDATDPARAVDAWKSVGESNAKTLSVQNAILESKAAWNDPQLIDQTIERVRALTGAQSHAWRTHRARWLLEHGSGEKDLAEAISLLNEAVAASENQIEPRRLLARALIKAKNLGGAIDQLRIAAERSPSPAVLLELVRTMHKAGQFEPAQEYLDRLARRPDPRPEVRREIARLYADQGNLQQAIDLLTRGPADSSTEALLAELYRRQAASGEAAALYEKILSDPDPAASALQGAAEFYASQGDLPRAQQVLARLKEKNLAPGVMALVLATFAERHLSAEEALAHYRAATEAAPKDPQTWTHLINFHIRSQRHTDALSAAEQALNTHPGNPDLEALKIKASMLASGQTPEDLGPLIDALAKDPNHAASVEALREIDQARKGGESPEQILARVERVAEKHPQLLPLQSMLVEGYLAQRQPAKAAQIAERTMNRLPASPAAAELATKAHLVAQNWDAVLFAAQQWRKLDPRQAHRADLMVAEAYLQTNRPGEARRHIQPHVEAALSKPDEGTNPALVLTFARALIRSGQSGQAAEMLLPLARQSREWRNVWLGLASSHRDADAAAQWVAQAAPLVGSAPEEQFVLARTWQEIGSSFAHAPTLEKARSLAKELAMSPAARAEAAMVWASAAELLNDLPDAEAAARRTLELSPELPGAMNNLAYFLYLQDKDLEQARELSAEAVKREPNQATYHDTYGRILARTGQTQQAIASFQQALKLDPRLVEARVGLAEVLARNGQPQEAQRQLDEIEAILSDAPPLPGAIRTQLERLKAELSSAM